MATETYKGVVKGNVVVLDKKLPEGTEVSVRPIKSRRGSPHAVLEAMKSLPGIPKEDVDELLRLIEEGMRPADFGDPFSPRRKKKSKR